jgi:hypothetical protein
VFLIIKPIESCWSTQEICQLPRYLSQANLYWVHYSKKSTINTRVPTILSWEHTLNLYLKNWLHWWGAKLNFQTVKKISLSIFTLGFRGSESWGSIWNKHIWTWFWEQHELYLWSPMPPSVIISLCWEQSVTHMHIRWPRGQWIFPSLTKF